MPEVAMRIASVGLFAVFLSLAQAPSGSGTGSGTGYRSFSPATSVTPPPLSTREESAAMSTNVPVVTGAPYSADVTTTFGERRGSPVKVFRDTEGRLRVEREMGSGPNAHLVIDISDPITQRAYTLDPPSKSATNGTWHPPMHVSADQGGGTTESLGSKTLEGLLCEGSRTTIERPTGPVTTEVWKSTDLQIAVLIQTKDPKFGERTVSLTNIVQADQPISLFQPPPDYRLEEEAYRIGGDVSAPVLIAKVEPAYSEEARNANYSGSVMLSIVVGRDGLPRDIKVVRPLGLGLDEKAIEAVSQWRFKPGMRDGKPVSVKAQVEVTFRLLDKRK